MIFRELFFWNFLGILWKFFENSLGIIWESFGNSLGILWKFFGDVWLGVLIWKFYEFYHNSFEFFGNSVEFFGDVWLGDSECLGVDFG